MSRWVQIAGGGALNLDRITTLKPVKSHEPGDPTGWEIEARGWSFVERLVDTYSSPLEAIDAIVGLVGFDAEVDR